MGGKVEKNWPAESKRRERGQAYSKLGGAGSERRKAKGAGRAGKKKKKEWKGGVGVVTEKSNLRSARPS